MNHFHIKKLTKWHIKMTRYQRWRPKISDITSLRRLKDVSLIYIPLKCLCDVLSWSVSLRYHLVRRYDVSNWSVSLTYQLRRRDDVLAWSTTYRPIWDLNETSLQGRVPGWLLLLLLAISILSLYLFYCNTTFIRHIYQKLIFINLKKIVCQDNLAFARLQFYKHNCLNILGDNICFHNQVKSQWKW